MHYFQGKKFVASYSGGKDSVLAIFRAVNAGLKPQGLITTHNTDEKRSWFHGMGEDLLKNASDSLAIPLTMVRTTGKQYVESFEKALLDAKSLGAEVCVFGDIDIEGHLEWCTARCEKTGLIPYFPLLREERRKVVYEFIDAGFLAIIKIVDSSRLPGGFLGKVLSREIVAEIEKTGADICGENGEYHTFVYGGPLFTKQVSFTVKEKLTRDKYLVLNIE
jgi:uncharacterized protein (TIGR00290 family)